MKEPLHYRGFFIVPYNNDMSLSHHFIRQFRPEKLRPPRDFIKPSLIQNSINLEIGAGKGKHALQFAVDHLEEKLFAIERTKGKFSVFEKQVKNKAHENLIAIHADVIPWTVYALPPKSLKCVYILYPNPEHNNPNQRWLNMPYFEFLLSRIKDGGTVVLASNIQSYIDESLEMATKTWNLEVVKSDIPAASERTHFEVKYLARGETCWQLDMKKPSGYVTRFDNWEAASKQQNGLKP